MHVYNNVDFNEEGKFLLLHHNSAAKYYKMNLIFLILFLGVSLRNYYVNSAIFVSESFGKFYISLIGLGILGMQIFGKRHIKSLYLLKNCKEISIETYSNFGLAFTKEKVFPISIF
jgi:hypothetical protein